MITVARVESDGNGSEQNWTITVARLHPYNWIGRPPMELPDDVRDELLLWLNAKEWALKRLAADAPDYNDNVQAWLTEQYEAEAGVKQ